MISTSVAPVVWQHLVPMAVCQMMLCLDRKEVMHSFNRSGAMLTAFAVASAGSFLGSLAAFLAVPLSNGWQMASVFCATYVGGTLNFIATADAVGLHDSAAIASGFSADMLMMAVSSPYCIKRTCFVKSKRHARQCEPRHSPQQNTHFLSNLSAGLLFWDFFPCKKG